MKRIYSIGCIAAITFAAAFLQGCNGLVNIENVDEINTEVTVAPGTEITVLNEKTFTLKDLISADGSNGTVTVSAEGEYAITYNLEPQTLGDGFTFDASQFALNFSGNKNTAITLTEAKIPANAPLEYNEEDKAALAAAIPGIDIDFFESLLSQDFSFVFDLDSSIGDFPKLISKFRKADLSGGISFRLVPAGIPFTKLVFKKGTSITFPEFMQFSACDNPDFTLSGNNVITAGKDVDVIVGQGLSIGLTLKALDFPNGISTANGLNLSGNVSVNGKIAINPADFNGSKKEVVLGSHKAVVVSEDTPLTAFVIGYEYAAEKVQLANATICLSKDALPSFDAGNFGFDIDGLPDFLSDSDAHVELSDVKVNLQVESALPFDFGLKTNLVAMTGSTVNHNIAIGPLNFPAFKKTSYTIDDPELGKILSPLPTRVEARDFDIIFYDSQWITVESGKNYGGTFSVGFEAPVSFTADTRLSLGIDEEFDVNLGKTGDIIKGETPVDISLTAVNTIPLNFGIEVQALDASKNAIPGVKAHFDKVAAGSLGNAQTTDVKISFTLPANSSIIKGIGLKMNAYSDKDFAGIPLNEKQSITVKNVKVGLPQGITTDLKDIVK